MSVETPLDPYLSLEGKKIHLVTRRVGAARGQVGPGDPFTRRKRLGVLGAHFVERRLGRDDPRRRPRRRLDTVAGGRTD